MHKIGVSKPHGNKALGGFRTFFKGPFDGARLLADGM